ncbi:MAG: hypothetical protein GY696_37570 [Gammaproteobacteria bacterium]|nr:hypothetical protein [Gammaproteobacteria bacterium]
MTFNHATATVPPVAPPLREQEFPSAAKTDSALQDQINSLNTAVASLVVQLNNKQSAEAQNLLPPQQVVGPQKIPGMTMKLPIVLPTFSGTGDQEFRTWIKVFERTTRACKVTSSTDLLHALDVYLTGPAARVFLNVQKLGVNTYEGMKWQLAEQFKSSALVRNASVSFMNRVQQPTERIVEYATVLFDLAEESYPEIPSEQIDFLLRDRFISGVLPEFIQFCEFEQCATFKAAFDCARKREERVLSAQAAQKGQNRGLNPGVERIKDERPTNFLLGNSDELDTYKQELRNSQKELIDTVRATVESVWKTGDTGQRGGRGRGGYSRGGGGNRTQRIFRWSEDGAPICSYCSMVGHKYRNCHKRQRDEENKRGGGRGGQNNSGNRSGGQNNSGNRPGGTQIVQDIAANPPTDLPTPCAKEEAWKSQNAIGSFASVDPYSLYLASQAVSPREPTFQQFGAQLNSLEEEVRDLRLASLHQANSVIVSGWDVDDSIVRRLLSPVKNLNLDDLDESSELDEDDSEEEPMVPSKISLVSKDEGGMTEGSIPTEELEKRKLNTLSAGEQKTVKTPVTLNDSKRPKPKFSNVGPGKPTIWTALLTILLFTNFWSQGLAQQTSVTTSDPSVIETPCTPNGSIFDPIHLWACFLFFSEGPYLARCAKVGLSEAWSAVTRASRSVGHAVFAAFHLGRPFFCIIELSIYGVKCRALVDTGASISIVSANFVKRLDNLTFQAPSTRATSMTSHSLPLTASTRIGLRLGTYAVKHRFQVMPGSPHDLIIGTDLLKHLKCVSFDFVNSCIVLPDNSQIPMIPYPNLFEHLSAPVHLVENVTLPPRSENILPCRVLFDVGTNIIIDSTPTRMVEKGIFLGKVLCDVREKNAVVVRALNPNPFPVKLYKNSTVAQAEVLTASEDVVCVAENERSPCDLMRGPSPAENPLDALSFDHSILTVEQKSRLMSLLSRFKHTFSTGPLDLGRTGLVKHVIPTGDAHPI